MRPHRQHASTARAKILQLVFRFDLLESLCVFIDEEQEKCSSIAKNGNNRKYGRETIALGQNGAKICAHTDGNPSLNILKRPFIAGLAFVDMISEQDAPPRNGHRIGKSVNKLDNIDVP